VADNFPQNPGSGRNVATDEVTHSGDTADVQLMRPVLVTGSEGSKTVVDLPGDATNGLKIDVSRQLHRHPTPTTASWTSATSQDTDHQLAVTGYATALLLIQTSAGTLTDGVLRFYGEPDGSTTFAPIAGYALDGVLTNNPGNIDASPEMLLVNLATLGVSDVLVLRFRVAGLSTIRVSLATAIVGSATVSLRWVASSAADGAMPPFAPLVAVTSADAPIVLRASDAGALLGSGDVAHDATDAGNPVKIGARAVAHGTNPTAVAAGDRTDLLASRAGIPWVIGGHPNVVSLEYATTGAQTDTAIVSVSAGTKIVVTQLQLLADNANTAFPSVRIGFGATNTPTTTGVVLSHPGVPAGGGVSRGDGSGILGIGGDGEDLRITCGAPTGGSLRVLVSYYTIES
jgi:hypothetical protein